MKKRYKVLIALAVFLCIALTGYYFLSDREIQARIDISRQLEIPVSIKEVFVDEYNIVWQDYIYAFRAITDSFDGDDLDEMRRQGWKSTKLPEEVYQQYAVPDIYKEDVKFYDAHYDCLWTYRDIEYERYRKKAFPEEEYRSLNYVFAFCVPERNLLYFVHEVY